MLRDSVNVTSLSDGKNWFLLKPALSAPGLLKNQVLRTASQYLIPQNKNLALLTVRHCRCIERPGALIRMWHFHVVTKYV